MASFGQLLRTYRLRSFAPGSNKPLSQEQLADLLAQAIGINSLSGATISNWERGKYQINKDDRATLVGLVSVLHNCGGLTSLPAANEFLIAGNYRPLDKKERRQANKQWEDEDKSDTQWSLLPAVESQEALLPPPSYTRLFGVNDIIETVCEKLDSANLPWVSTIVGLGGLGKTAIANAVARRLIDGNYFERVIWLPGETQEVKSSDGFSNSTLEMWTLAIGDQLLSRGLERSNPDRRLVQVRNILKTTPHLIVIDDIGSQQLITSTLDQLNNLAGPSKFLLTSRHHPPPDANVFIYLLKGLEIEDALALLRHQAATVGVNLSEFLEEELVEVCEIVGGHPLILRFIPKLILIQSLPQILVDLQLGEEGYLAKLYQLIYQNLWQSLLPQEKEILFIMLLVSYTGAKPEQLMEISGLKGRGFWSPITKLTEQCLIELRGTIHDRRYGVHNLTAQFLYGLRFQPENTVHDTYPHYVIANLNYWKKYMEQVTEQSWDQLDREYPNILRSIQASLELPPGKITSTIRELWLFLSRNLFKFAERRGYWHEWIQLLEQLILQFEGTAKCELFNQLGNLHRYNRQLTKAIQVHQEGEQLARQIRSEEKLAHLCASLGLDYLHRRQYDAAEEYGEEALDIFSRLELTGKELGGTLNLLGLVARARGNFETAEECLYRSLHIWRQLEQPIELGRALNNLALTCQDQKKYEMALKYFSEARTVLEETTSELDRVMVALSEGSLYFELGGWSDASAVFDGINLSFLRQSGHIFYEALTLNNMGNVFLVMENLNKAENFLRRSMSLWKQIGEEVRLANTSLVLGNVHVKLGRLEEAKIIYDDTAKLLDKYQDDYRAGQLRKELKEELGKLSDRKKRLAN